MIQNAYDFLVQDPTLKPIVKQFPLIKNPSDDLTIHDSLLKSIISQQLSVKAAQTIYNRFTNRLGIETDLLLLENISLQELRGLGLSKQKSHYVKNVASFFLEEQNQNLNWATLSDEDITDRLTKIKGVGVWTVHMLLIFNLNRPDVLPLGDLIVRKGLTSVLGVNETGKELIQALTLHCEKWRPFRSYVSRLMWEAKDALDF